MAPPPKAKKTRAARRPRRRKEGVRRYELSRDKPWDLSFALRDLLRVADLWQSGRLNHASEIVRAHHEALLRDFLERISGHWDSTEIGRVGSNAVYRDDVGLPRLEQRVAEIFGDFKAAQPGQIAKKRSDGKNLIQGAFLEAGRRASEAQIARVWNAVEANPSVWAEGPIEIARSFLAGVFLVGRKDAYHATKVLGSKARDKQGRYVSERHLLERLDDEQYGAFSDSPYVGLAYALAILGVPKNAAAEVLRIVQLEHHQQNPLANLRRSVATIDAADFEEDLTEATDEDEPDGT